MMRRGNPRSIPVAVRIYWNDLELGTNDIRNLFGCSARVARGYKEAARELQEERGVKSWHPDRVETRTAYEAWGLDINDLERRLGRMKKFGFLEEGE